MGGLQKVEEHEMLYLVKVSDKIGLSIYIVVPIIVYGSELWLLGDKCVRLNEDLVGNKCLQCRHLIPVHG